MISRLVPVTVALVKSRREAAFAAGDKFRGRRSDTAWKHRFGKELKNAGLPQLGYRIQILGRRGLQLPDEDDVLAQNDFVDQRA